MLGLQTELFGISIQFWPLPLLLPEEKLLSVENKAISFKYEASRRHPVLEDRRKQRLLFFTEESSFIALSFLDALASLKPILRPTD